MKQLSPSIINNMNLVPTSTFGAPEGGVGSSMDGFNYVNTTHAVAQALRGGRDPSQ
jgi:hypothetical protein